MHSRKALSFVCAFIGLASSAPTTTSAPPSDPTPSGVTPDRILAVHDAWIPTNISNSTVVPPAVANVSIILPPPVGTNPPDFTDLSSQAFNKSLPFLLEQLGVDAADIPDLVAEAIPLFNDIVIGSISGGNSSSADPSANLRRRGLFSKIGKWVKKVVNKAVNVVEDVASDAGCSVFAAGALPGYLVSADLFKVQNVFKIPSPTSSDQDFYIFPLHGPISHNDGIVVYYQANFPPGFGSADGVTMGRNIYLRGAKASVSTDAAFKSTTKILLHEFTHSKQYQSFGYNLNAFGLKYLFEYCKAGFSYKNDALEKDAYAKQELMNSLLTDTIGSQFIRVWKARGLVTSLGLPTSRTYTNSSPGRFSLTFQRGTLTMTCSGTVCS